MAQLARQFEACLRSNWLRGARSFSALPLSDPTFVVWSPNTDIGKTVICGGLAKVAADSGVRPCACSLQPELCYSLGAQSEGAEHQNCSFRRCVSVGTTLMITRCQGPNSCSVLWVLPALVEYHHVIAAEASVYTLTHHG